MSQDDDDGLPLPPSMTELNGRFFTVANPTTLTFELQGEDSSSYPAYVAGGRCTNAFVRNMVPAFKIEGP
jgi:hypothetical protein